VNSRTAFQSLALVALVALTAVPTTAHPLSVSYARFSIDARSVAAVVRLPLDDVDLLLRLDKDLDGHVSAAEIDAARSAIDPYVAKHLRVRSAGAALEPRLTRLALWTDPAGFQYLEADAEFTAPDPIESFSIEIDFLSELYAQHKTLGELRIAGRSEQFVFEPRRVFAGRAAERHRWADAASFVRLGIEHIFTGYDHILFLFGLLLVGNGLRNLVAVVTSFTVAHSLTLALATLGAVQPVPWTIEAAIALSLAYIGIENLLVSNPRYRWKITFVFGLVHGFGFAAVLRDMHLPRAGVAISLFSFNVGVEIGQVAIVSLMYPLLLLLARTRHRVLVTRIASSIITIVGLVWFYQRIP